jgi:hypothetical protein
MHTHHTSWTLLSDEMAWPRYVRMPLFDWCVSANGPLLRDLDPRERSTERERDRAPKCESGLNPRISRERAWRRAVVVRSASASSCAQMRSGW